MDNLHTETRQIAARLRGARMTADKSAAELAACTGMSEEAYLKMEEGAEDYSFTFLYKCAKALDLDISALVSGDDPKLSFYTLTRAGEGMPIKRRAIWPPSSSTARPSRSSSPRPTTRRSRRRRLRCPPTPDRSSIWC